MTANTDKIKFSGRGRTLTQTTTETIKFPGRGRTLTETTTETISVDRNNARNDVGNTHTSSPISQDMFSNAICVNTKNGHFDNVADNQSNVYRIPAAESRRDALNVNNTSPNTVGQSMYMYAQNVNARNGQVNNVGGPQSNTYHGSNANHSDGSSSVRGRYLGTGAYARAGPHDRPPPNSPGQVMFTDAQGIDARSGHFNNVGDSQSNIYNFADGSNPNCFDSSCDHVSGTCYAPRAHPNAVPRPSPNIASQAMFIGAQDVDARHGHFNNVGGTQSNTYHHTNDSNANHSDGSSSVRGRYLGTGAYAHAGPHDRPPPNSPGQAMFTGARGIDATNGHFSNVGGSQTNWYF